MPSQLLNDAIIFTVEQHCDQLDKAGKPYIFHPLRVMLAVIDQAESAQIVAVLHNVLEDFGVTLDTLENLFGEEIRDGVDSVSMREGPPKELYNDFVIRSKQNKIGRKVKLADLDDNF